MEDTVQLGSPLTEVESVVKRPSVGRVEVVGRVLDTTPIALSAPIASVDEAALRLAAMEFSGEVPAPPDEGERMP